MKIGVIVQARLSSTRLPGKVLLPVAGKPILQLVIERVQRVPSLDFPVVATSDERDDDCIVDFCERHRIRCGRGSLENVASRFLGVVREHNLDAFVRVCADSPLLDPDLIVHAVKLFRDQPCDLVTNIMPRTFPSGQSVEVVGAAAFEEACILMRNSGDFEHVTPVFYRETERFRIRNFESSRRLDDVHLAIDTREDYETLAAIFNRMDQPHWSYRLDDIVTLYREVFSARDRR